MTAIKPVQLERIPGPPSTDYAFLRKKAIEKIQELSGRIWTDYNLHDPGITILEHLCYAITDLGYKTDFPIEDILANKHGRIDGKLHSFFTKADILTSGPITANDYRKLVLDQIDQIENIWIEQQDADNNSAGCNKGVFRIFIQAEDETAIRLQDNPEAAANVVSSVKECLHAHRNVGQDFEEPKLLIPQDIYIKAEVMVDWRQDAQAITAKICNAFEFTIHPPVRFFTEAELLSMGMSIEHIYTGPLLRKGFVIDTDLKPRIKRVDPAELIKAISMVDGVLKVKSLLIAGEDGQYTSRPIDVKEQHYPFIRISSELHDIRIFSDKFEERSKDAAFWNTYQQVKIVAKRNFVGQRTGNLLLSMNGEYRNIGEYHSIQHLFPHIYHLGEHNRLSNEMPATEQAQARQLKAYLLFFEQLMANYLAQLQDIGDLFAPVTDDPDPATYAIQPLYDVPYIKELLQAFQNKETEKTDAEWASFMADRNNDYIKALKQGLESDNTYRHRKHKILDHLLARFNIQLHKYFVVMYEQHYNNRTGKKRVNAALKWKSDVLTHAAGLTSKRIQSCNYLRYDGKEPLPGYDAMLYKLLHITADKQQPLTAVFDTPAWKVAVVGRTTEMPTTWSERIYHQKEEDIRVLVPDHGHEDRHYDYGHQPLSFLRMGLDLSHYRIIFDEENREYLVIYKQGKQEVWTAVIRERTKDQANKALRHMIRQLQQISVNSEGCYLVEHLLLRPHLDEETFGFRILNTDGRKLMTHADWMTFGKREELLRQLINESPAQTENTALEIYDRWSDRCKMYMRVGNHTLVITRAHFQDEELRHIAAGTIESLLLNFTELKQHPEYRRHIKYYVKHDDRYIVDEEFFRFRISMLFPAWPARFQVPEFRAATQELVKENTPAHIKLKYKWLGVAAMHEFESYYFPWREALQQQEANTASFRYQLTKTALIRYLVEEKYLAPAF